MHNRLTNYDKPDINISCSESNYISHTFHTINFYNMNVKYPLQKYIFHIKNAKIIKKCNNSIDVILANFDSDINFIKYIDALDVKIHECLCSRNNYKYNINKSYETRQYFPPVFNMNISECLVFNDTNKKTDIIIDDNTTCSIIIELSSVLADDTNYWFNYSAKQIKLNPNVFNDNMFDAIENVNSVNNAVIPAAPPLNINNTNTNTNTETETKRILPNIMQNEIINFIKKDSNINLIKSEKPAEKTTNTFFSVSPFDLKKQLDKFKEKKTNKDNIVLDENITDKINTMKKEINDSITKKLRVDNRYNNIQLN